MLCNRKMIGESEWIEKSGVIKRFFLEMPEYKKASSLLCYCHFGREVRTDGVIRDALSAGKAVCIPYNDWRQNIFIPSRIYSQDDIAITEKIPGPAALNPFPAEKIDIAVIPGAAFDLQGNRIGMGRGFFDRFMEERGEKILKVSLAFDFQVFPEELPVDPWDRKVDVIITETRIIKI